MIQKQLPVKWEPTIFRSWHLFEITALRQTVYVSLDGVCYRHGVCNKPQGTRKYNNDFQVSCALCQQWTQLLPAQCPWGRRLNVKKHTHYVPLANFTHAFRKSSDCSIDNVDFPLFLKKKSTQNGYGIYPVNFWTRHIPMCSLLSKDKWCVLIWRNILIFYCFQKGRARIVLLFILNFRHYFPQLRHFMVNCTVHECGHSLFLVTKWMPASTFILEIVDVPAFIGIGGFRLPSMILEKENVRVLDILTFRSTRWMPSSTPY